MVIANSCLTGQIRRFQMYMNAIQKNSKSKWKQFSYIYSKILIRLPWSILSFSLFITIGLSVCFFLLKKISLFNESAFIMHNSPAMKNAFRIRQIFGNDVELRIHQQLNLYPGLDIIIKRKLNTTERSYNQTNMLNDQIIQEVLKNKLIFLFFLSSSRRERDIVFYIQLVAQKSQKKKDFVFLV